MSKAKQVIEINPTIIRFTHSKIRPVFTGCGKRIEQTLQEIINGETNVSDLPMITVIENDGEYYSLNNRRLYTIKKIQSLGLLEGNKIKAYIKPALNREKIRYTPERCSLTAKIVPENKSEEIENSHNEEDINSKESPDIQQQNFDSPGLVTKKEFSKKIEKMIKKMTKLKEKGKIVELNSEIDEMELVGEIDSEEKLLIKSRLGLA